MENQTMYSATHLQQKILALSNWQIYLTMSFSEFWENLRKIDYYFDLCQKRNITLTADQNNRLHWAKEFLANRQEAQIFFNQKKALLNFKNDTLVTNNEYLLLVNSAF